MWEDYQLEDTLNGLDQDDQMNMDKNEKGESLQKVMSGFHIPEVDVEQMGPSKICKENQGMELTQPKVNHQAAGQKTKWGPVLAERRSTRIRNDGRTSLEKAQEQKKEGRSRGYICKR
jgi:hypothetical protein